MDLDSSRVRRPSHGFGWVDHRIVSGGYLVPMEQAEVVVYLLLCVVADRRGISYYNPATLARLTKCSVERVRDALASLAARELIAVCDRFVQVVDLDARCPPPAKTPPRPVAGTRPTGAQPPAAAPEPAAVVLARLPESVREDLVSRARGKMAALLCGREPSPAVVEAVAAGILREEVPS